MKNLIIGALFIVLFSTSAGAAEQEIYAFTDYTPVRVMYLSAGADVEVEAQKAGLSGTRKKITRADLPADRSARNAWKVKAGKVEVDPKLKKDLDDKKEAENSKKSKLVGRLKAAGLDDEDILTLGVKL